MRLMMKALEKRFAQVGSQRNVKDPVIIAEFYTLDDSGLWYATEYHPAKEMFFGYVVFSRDQRHEWTSFDLEELE